LKLIWSLALSVHSLLLLDGCATSSERFVDAAIRLGLSAQELQGRPYLHRLFVNEPAQQAKSIEVLHVYLDGDGSPWIFGTRIADDPTPRNPLILYMMEKDQGPAVLLGRPCYYGLNLSKFCNSALWTSDRYSGAVVESMRGALQHWLATKEVKRLVLIGFSGGGSLAALLASRLDKVSTLITIAANLDVKRWSDFHGYIPPEGSLNPVNDAQIAPGIWQIHLAGLRDKNVPAEIVEAFSSRQQNALYLAYPEYDHTCCWLDIWPMILNTYAAEPEPEPEP
jgi:hypothetical protein